MKKLHKIFVLIAVPIAGYFFASKHAEAAPLKSIITSSVIFQGLRDPGIVTFTDGSSVEITSSNGFDHAARWKNGTELSIIFNPNYGVLLTDTKTGIDYQVLELYGRPHPLDIWLKRCEAKGHNSDYAIESCLSSASKMWFNVIKFDYKFVARSTPSDGALPAFDKSLLINQKVWGKYYQAYTNMIDNYFKYQGTYWSQLAGMESLNVLRNQDRVILALLSGGDPKLGMGRRSNCIENDSTDCVRIHP